MSWIKSENSFADLVTHLKLGLLIHHILISPITFVKPESIIAVRLEYHISVAWAHCAGERNNTFALSWTWYT